RRERGVEETILAHQFHGEGAVRLVLAACAPKEGGEKKAKSRHVTCSHGGPLLHVATARTQRGTLPRRFAAPTGPPAAAARREQPSRRVGDESEVDLSPHRVHAGQFHAPALADAEGTARPREDQPLALFVEVEVHADLLAADRTLD